MGETSAVTRVVPVPRPGVQFARASSSQRSMSSGTNRKGPSSPPMRIDGMRPVLAASYSQERETPSWVATALGFIRVSVGCGCDSFMCVKTVSGANRPFGRFGRHPPQRSGGAPGFQMLSTPPPRRRSVSAVSASWWWKASSSRGSRPSWSISARHTARAQTVSAVASSSHQPSLGIPDGADSGRAARRPSPTSSVASLGRRRMARARAVARSPCPPLSAGPCAHRPSRSWPRALRHSARADRRPWREVRQRWPRAAPVAWRPARGARSAACGSP